VWAYVFAEVLDPVYNSIPGLKDWKADPKTIREKLGMLGDPVMISFLLFFAVGLLAYFPDVMTALQMAVLAGAMLYIMPKMTTIIMEGITPIADAIKTKTAKSKRFKNIYIGVDSYILAGYEDVISSSMFAMVILALLCLVVPWINIIPLMTLPWLVGDTNMICARHKGNVIRATITTVIFYLVGIVIAQMAAPLYTQVVAAHMSALFPVTPGTLQICAGPYRTWMYLWQFLLQGIGLVNI
jgi:PTS system galactitol-specific IIC component